MRQGHGIGWTKSRCCGKGQVEVIKKLWRPVLIKSAHLLGKQEVSRLMVGRSGVALDLLHQFPSTIMRT